MKNSEFQGLYSVLKFTLTQVLKQKSYIISLVIMVVFSIGVFPVMKLVNLNSNNIGITDDNEDDNKGDYDKEEISINKAYVLNETNLLEIPFDKMLEEYEALKGIELVPAEGDIEALCDQLEAGDDADKNAVIIHAVLDNMGGGYRFAVYYAPESNIDEDNAMFLADTILEWFSEYKINSVNVDSETIDNISAMVSITVLEYEDFIDEDGAKAITDKEYNVIYIILMVFYMVIVIVSSMVANKVVEEKANRIVEYLMTTIRPLALIMGKIIAMLISGVGMIVLMLGSGYASYTVCEKIWPAENDNVMSSFISFDGINGLGFGNIMLMIVILILGVLMYSIIAGLFGASVSKMEEMQQGLKVFNVIIIISFFLVMAGVNIMWNVGFNIFVKVLMYVPVTSVLLLPGVILIGKAGALEIIISLVLMLAFTAFLLWFVSLVYESVIVTNGNIISIKAMIAMAKDSAKKKKGGAADEK